MILIWILFGRSIGELFSVLVYSEYTATDLVAELSDSIASDPDHYISMARMSEHLVSSLDPLRLNTIFDYTFSIVYGLQLKFFARSHHILYFSNRPEIQDKWVFSHHSSASTEARAINQLLGFLAWDDFHLVSSEDKNARLTAQHLSNGPISALSSTVNQQVYDHFVGRSVKPTGNWKVVAVTESQGASKLLRALKNMKIYKERCGFVISSRGVTAQFDTGTLLVSEEGLEFSKSEGQYEFNSIIRALNTLDRLSTINLTTDNEKLRTLLEESTLEHSLSNTFSILNYTPDLKIIGNITDKVHIDHTIVFPGNVTEFNTSPPIINISGNLGLFNPDNTISGGTYVLNGGILPMVQLINKDPSMLTNFVLEIHGTDCGPEKLDYNYVSQCMPRHFNSLGAFYIDTHFETVGIGNIQVFRENGITIPHTGIFYDPWEYYDKEEFPELFILTAHTMYLFAIIPYILNSFRWKHILVYFHDNVASDIYDAFMKNAEILQISVLNKCKYVPYFYPDQSFEDANKDTLEEAVSLNCRIYVLLIELPHSIYFIQSLHDLGVKKGDAVFVLRHHPSYYINSESLYEFNKEKVLELIDGSISLFQNEYIGEYGRELEKQISDLIFPQTTPFTCFQIDSLLLGVRAIDWMLDLGRDYEDPQDLNYFMRQLKFVGCSGPVSIDSGGNGRNELTFNLHNFHVKDGEEVEPQVGNYTIGITIPLQISKGIIWPNGSTEIPEDIIKAPECGIAESDIQNNQNSIFLTAYGTIAYFLIVCAGSFIVWFKYYRFKIERITTRTELMFEDGVEMGIPFIETSQYIAIGPGTSVLNYLSMLLGINSILEFKNNIFWRVFYIIIGVSTTWSFSIISVIFLAERRYPKILKDFTRYIGLTMLPLIAKIGFIPILWMISRIFECKEGDGDDLQDSFLKYDCNVRCWEGYHLGISIMSIVVLTVYSILSSISGPMYDKVMNHVNIKTDSFFSVTKTIFNMILLILSFHLKETNKLIFAIVYFIICVAWTIFAFKRNSFNYVRLILWQNMLLVGLCCHMLMMVFIEIVDIPLWISFLVDLLILLVLASAILVIHIKYIPGYFYKRKGRNFQKLLNFAYTTRTIAKELTEHRLDYRIRSEEIEIEVEPRLRLNLS